MTARKPRFKIEQAKPWWSGLGKRIFYRIFLLDPADTVSTAARRAHIGVIAGIALTAVAAALMSRSDSLQWQRVSGGVIFIPIALYMLERQVSLLYGWPLSATGGKKSTLATHPLLIWLISVILFSGAILGPEPLYVVQDPSAALAAKAVVITGVIAGTLPFWIATFLYIPMRRKAFQWRGKPPLWQAGVNRIMGRRSKVAQHTS